MSRVHSPSLSLYIYIYIEREREREREREIQLVVGFDPYSCKIKELQREN